MSTLRWRYYKHLDEFWAFIGNVPVFSPAVGIARKLDKVWIWEVRYPGAGVTKLYRKGTTPDFRKAKVAIEYYFHEVVEAQ